MNFKYKKASAVTSDGVEYPNHKHLTKSQKKLAKLQRQLSQKSKGSNRREKARVKAAHLHEHISNQRSDMPCSPTITGPSTWL
ncbi:MAG: transposase [Oscillospiraceae bacterium]|nr:transposase [Oscillospiraceae bacterium]